jgi:hypothetical protein
MWSSSAARVPRVGVRHPSRTAVAWVLGLVVTAAYVAMLTFAGILLWL